MRAVDHCVEGVCSLQGATEETIDTSLKALGLLVPGLLKCAAADPQHKDLEAILQCQLGSADAIKGVAVYKVSLGGSHAIGHQLGPFGILHGETSCILLPAVCRYNQQHADDLPPAQAATVLERQERVQNFLLEDPTVRGVLAARLPDFDAHKPDLATILDAVFRQLGMPRSLSDVGVKLSPEKLDALALHSLEDPWCPTNPIPLTTKEQVLEILRQVV